MFHRLKEFMDLKKRENKTENEEREFEFKYHNFEEFKQAMSEKKPMTIKRMGGRGR